MTRYKERYHERENAGLCVRCGKKSPVANEKLCDECKQYFTQRRINAPETAKLKRQETHRLWKSQNPDRVLEKDKRYRNKLRQEAIEHYGGKCACCGETNIAFLTLDHIDGCGNQHRRSLFGANVSGNAFYRKMRALGYPSGLQVLCWNCNMAKAHYGICPHQNS